MHNKLLSVHSEFFSDILFFAQKSRISEYFHIPKASGGLVASIGSTNVFNFNFMGMVEIFANCKNIVGSNNWEFLIRLKFLNSNINQSPLPLSHIIVRLLEYWIP